jgi:hypothetical protein
MLFTTLPLIAMGAYMWATGKGQSMISGYNTMSKAQKAHYDAVKLAKDTGKVVVAISIILLLWSFAFFERSLIMPASVAMAGSMFIVIFVFFMQSKGGKYLKNPMNPPPPATKEERKRTYAILGVSLGVSAVVMVIVIIMIGSGSVNAEMDDERLHIDAPMVSVSIGYDEIFSLEVRENMDLGYRVSGFGGTKVLSGYFNNSEFGDYTLACYKDVKTYIVVKPKEGKMIVFNLDTAEGTLEFYRELVDKMDYDLIPR